MKILALFTIFVLIFGITSTSLVSEAYAQKNTNILLDIATQADTQILNQLDSSYGDLVPSDIQTLYEKGHAAVESLESSLPNDVEQAREDFLAAMKSFMEITRMVSEPVTEAKLATSSDMSDRDLKSELNRLHKYFQSLKTIFQKHNMETDLSEIERLFVLAYEQINSDGIEKTNTMFYQLESLIDIKNQEIREYSSNSSSDRIIEFALKQLEKIQTILEDPYIDTSMPEFENANSLVAEIKVLISEDNISVAKEKFGELNKIMKIIESSTVE